MSESRIKNYWFRKHQRSLFALTKDFAAASMQLEKDMNQLLLEKRAFLDILPFLDLGHWGARHNNCYNYSMNRRSNDFLQPGKAFSEAGRISADSRGKFKKYVEAVRLNALKDGLHPLGKSFLECREKDIPVALFFRNGADGYEKHDFHWMGLRKTPVEGKSSGLSILWAHKRGPLPAEKCSSDKPPDHASVFLVAKKRGHNYFAGFYGVPQSLWMK